VRRHERGERGETTGDGNDVGSTMGYSCCTESLFAPRCFSPGAVSELFPTTIYACSSHAWRKRGNNIRNAAVHSLCGSESICIVVPF